MKKIFIIVLVIVVVVAAIFYFLSRGIYRSVGDLEQGSVELEIEKGDSALEIGRALEESGLISSKFYFVFYVLKEGFRGDMKAGQYSVDAGLTIPEVVSVIIQGGKDDEEDDIQKKLTFPEGWDAKKIHKRLEDNGLAVNDFMELFENPAYFSDKYGYDFLENLPENATLEGYLFPDTYFFLNDATSEDIIKKMLDNFEIKLSQELKDATLKQGKDIHEVIIMASLLEREVRSDNDKKIVSGIFWDRIEVGQALQSCATLAYIIGENKKQYSYEDTRIDSLYNTYLHPGLPPGPIANPGISSIIAAVHPTETEYNYFLTSQETGETIFSKTLEEHNLNKTRHGL